MQLIFPAAMELVSTRRWDVHHGNTISAVLLWLVSNLKRPHGANGVAFRAKITTTGGKRLAAKVKEHERATNRLRNIVVEVGFRDRRMAVLAGRLEYGDPSTNLPERPAFRLGALRVRRVVQGMVAGKGLMTASVARDIAIAARDTLRQAYREYHGPGLSARQKSRKRGSRFADDELIGSEGPKLIGHIHGYVNGERL